MNIFGSNSIFNHLNTVGGATILVVVSLIILLIVLITKILHANIFDIMVAITNKIIAGTSKLINKREKRYHRDIEIGKLSEKRMRVKTYKFLNDLIIDLGLKKRGANPYEFLLLVVISALIATIAMCELLFNNLVMVILMYPITFSALTCSLYTRANIAHDTRIEAIIEAENIISNNIKEGVVVAIRNNLDVIPLVIRTEFKDFLDNITHKNYHIRTALLELNNNLGSTADDFIKQCIVFEMEEEHGIVGMFQDVVEVNNIKTENRIDMKRKFEEVSTEFTIGAIMIFVFLGGIMAAFKIVANIYLHTIPGQLVMALDFLLLVGEFVYITYLRAQEL